MSAAAQPPAPRPSRDVIRAAGFADAGARPYQEDRWAAAELPAGALAAVADGMSDPTGRGRRGEGSALVAEAAAGTFVATASRLLERAHGGPDGVSPVNAVVEAFDAAARRAADVAAEHGGGAAFVGAWLGNDGRAVVVKLGDCRAWGYAAGRWQVLTVRDDADRTGALTHWLGQPAARLPRPVVLQREGVDAVVVGSDGLYRTGALDRLAPPGPTFRAVPFAIARDLVTDAVRAGETDNITACVLARSRASWRPRLSEIATPALYLTGAGLLFAAGVFAAALFMGGAG